MFTRTVQEPDVVAVRVVPETEQNPPPVATLNVSAPPPDVVDDSVAVSPAVSDVLDEATVTTRLARPTAIVMTLDEVAAS